MLVLTGYTLEHVTSGTFKAASHDVVSMANHAYMERLQTIIQWGMVGNEVSAAEVVLAFGLYTAIHHDTQLLIQVMTSIDDMCAFCALFDGVKKAVDSMCLFLIGAPCLGTDL